MLCKGGETACGSQWRESRALFLSIKSEVPLRATRVGASAGVFLASVAALSTDLCVTRQIIFALSLSSELHVGVRLVGSVDRSYDCFATRCGLIVLVAWEMTNLGKESAVVLSRANTLQHILECWHASVRPLLRVRVGRLKVTELTKLVVFGVGHCFSYFDMSVFACFFECARNSIAWWTCRARRGSVGGECAVWIPGRVLVSGSRGPPSVLDGGMYRIAWMLFQFWILMRSTCEARVQVSLSLIAYGVEGVSDPGGTQLSGRQNLFRIKCRKGSTW